MKKITNLLIIVILFAIPFISTHAQTITKDDIKAVAPQLIKSLNQLSLVLGQKQAQFNQQNIALTRVVNTMGAIVNNIADLQKQNLSDSDEMALDSATDMFSTSISSFSGYVGRVTTDRKNFSSALDGVVSILGSITSAVVSAVNS